MFKPNEKITYNKVNGEIISITGELAMIKLEDGKQYAVEVSQLRPIKVIQDAPSEMSGIMEVLRSHIKNMSFLEGMAAMISKSGISELSFKSGRVSKYEAKESLEEKIAKYRAEANAEAERKATEEFAKENQMSVA